MSEARHPIGEAGTHSDAPEAHDGRDGHDGHDGHDAGVWALLEARVEHELHEPAFKRDPGFIDEVVPLIQRGLQWFEPEVRGFETLPARGPFLMAGNHCGGLYMPDAFVFMSEFYKRRGSEAEAYALAYDFVFQVPGVGPTLRRLGGLPACHANAAKALEQGAAVLVYPGGDEDAYRPWVDRHHIDLHGHKGFIRLALRHQVPLYPIVSHGSHETIIVLFRGEAIARALRLDRLRVNVFPILAGFPWGVAPVWMPMLPLPTKLAVQVCEPFDWSDLGPEAADDDTIVDHCYAEVLGRMQASLDELVRETPHPVMARLGSLFRR